eukprot:378852_1
MKQSHKSAIITVLIFSEFVLSTQSYEPDKSSSPWLPWAWVSSISIFSKSKCGLEPRPDCYESTSDRLVIDGVVICGGKGGDDARVVHSVHCEGKVSFKVTSCHKRRPFSMAVKESTRYWALHVSGWLTGRHPSVEIGIDHHAVKSQLGNICTSFFDNYIDWGGGIAIDKKYNVFQQ